MKKLLLLTLLVIFAVSQATYACDLDNDGIDDPTTYTEDDAGSYTWQSKLSSDGSTQTVTSFGETGGFPVPGNYLGANNPSYYTYVSPDQFWKIYLAADDIFTGLNFGLINPSYLGGHDYNGDGVADACKISNRCSKFKANCHRTSTPRFTILLNQVENDRPFANNTLTPRVFGKGLSPVFIMDANNDGADDICYAEPNRRNRKVFKAFCHNVLTEARVARFTLGKLHNLPVSATINNSDQAVLWRSRNQRGLTKIVLVDTSGTKTKFTINSVGEVVVGDWLGTGSDQIGVAGNSLLTIYNPLDSSTSTMSIPSGTPVDCNNNLYGRAAQKFLKSRNVCRVFNCK